MGRVNRVAWLSSSSQVMIGGLFASPRISLARLNSSGSTDYSFSPHFPIVTGPTPEVLALADNVGRYVVGGSGASGSFLTRLTYTGMLDPGFGPTGPSTPAPNAIIFIPGGVNDLFIQGDGKILVGGSFTNINDGSANPPRGCVARFTDNGALDGSFTTNPGAGNSISVVAPQSGGRILIGGSFTSYNWIPRIRLARLNSDGSLDYSFNPGTGANLPVLTILPLSNKALIGGSFYFYNNNGRYCLARILTRAVSPAAAALLLLN